MRWGIKTTAGYLGYLPTQGATKSTLPKPPSESEMRDLLAALEPDDPPGQGRDAAASEGNPAGSPGRDLEYCFRIKVPSMHPYLVQSPSKSVAVLAVSLFATNTCLSPVPAHRQGSVDRKCPLKAVPPQIDCPVTSSLVHIENSCLTAIAAFCVYPCYTPSSLSRLNENTVD